MKTKTRQNRVVISIAAENEKQKLPVHFVVSLAAGAVAGMVVIFGLFMAVEKLLGM